MSRTDKWEHQSDPIRSIWADERRARDPPSCGKDPMVYISMNVSTDARRSYAKGRAQTDAHDASHLDPRWVVERAAEYAESASRDSRYTEASREADGALAAVLRDWLAERAEARA